MASYSRQFKLGRHGHLVLLAALQVLFFTGAAEAAPERRVSVSERAILITEIRKDSSPNLTECEWKLSPILDTGFPPKEELDWRVISVAGGGRGRHRPWSLHGRAYTPEALGTVKVCASQKNAAVLDPSFPKCIGLSLEQCTVPIAWRSETNIFRDLKKTAIFIGGPNKRIEFSATGACPKNPIAAIPVIWNEDGFTSKVSPHTIGGENSGSYLLSASYSYSSSRSCDSGVRSVQNLWSNTNFISGIQDPGFLVSLPPDPDDMTAFSGSVITYSFGVRPYTNPIQAGSLKLNFDSNSQLSREVIVEPHWVGPVGAEKVEAKVKYTVSANSLVGEVLSWKNAAAGYDAFYAISPPLKITMIVPSQ